MRRRAPVDLTMRITPRLPAFPGSPRAHFIPWASPRTDGYALELVAMSTHTGTHIDAPYHFDAGGDRVGDIRLSRLVGPALLMRARRGRGRCVGAAEIESLEAECGRLARSSRLVIETGWSSRVDARYFERSPGLDADAARLLARRRVGLVGIDSPSVDAGDSESFPAHRALARAGTVIVENLCNLGRVAASPFELAVLPLRLERASGAPARAVAL